MRGILIVALALSAFGCSSRPPARAPLEMVKIETSPSLGSNHTPPLSLHSKIENSSSANDLDNSGPKLSEPAKERKNEPKFAAPEQHVGLTKHSTVSPGGNLHGYRN